MRGGNSSSSRFFTMHHVVFLYFLTVIAGLSISFTEGKIVSQVWKVENQYKSLDCVKKLVISINGMTPGPTIYAQEGDTVSIEVNNFLMNNSSTIVHWHGIRMIGVPWFDGVQKVTQCPILAGDKLQYVFLVDQAGTYMYHSHWGMQKSNGPYGMIVVSPKDGVVEPFKYDHDRSIMLSDWYHKSVEDQTKGLFVPPFTWVGEPQSLLIQGRGRYNCSFASKGSVCQSNNTDCSPYMLTVDAGKTYRLRIGSLASLSALSFEIQGHNMTVVEADGHYVAPFVVSSLYIYSGETYSVLFTANQDPSRNYWMAVNVVARLPNTDTGLAILNYRQNNTTTPTTAPPIGPLWNDTASRISQSLKLRAHPDRIISPPKTSDQKILMLSTENTGEHGLLKWSVNNVSSIWPEYPFLISLKKNFTNAFNQTSSPVTYDYKNYDIYSVPKYPNTTYTNSIYRLKFNSTVDLILQNANTLEPNHSGTHPWHLHGHNFWVMGYGTGKYDPEADLEKTYNLVDPIMKNTVPVHPYGWTVIRFIADNPGVWTFHCHIDAHLVMGMVAFFEEGIDRVGALPNSILGCLKH
ncbi:L-ascorbate oxidase [Zostera marina]|uniref:L-ascorbate oxidase n=1 Tax=Zostera marina TaxID=29655 RepID=A0A0K9NK79_ZOSMR|nr:L-ascorbate oxidase [Zostera marina]